MRKPFADTSFSLRRQILPLMVFWGNAPLISGVISSGVRPMIRNTPNANLYISETLPKAQRTEGLSSFAFLSVSNQSINNSSKSGWVNWVWKVWSGWLRFVFRLVLVGLVGLVLYVWQSCQQLVRVVLASSSKICQSRGQLIKAGKKCQSYRQLLSAFIGDYPSRSLKLRYVLIGYLILKPNGPPHGSWRPV